MKWEQLSDGEKAEHLRHSETELTALVDWTKGLASTADLSQVEEYLDHAEYGLALEGLYDLLMERRLQLPKVERDRVARLAKHMGLQDTVIADRLP